MIYYRYLFKHLKELTPNEGLVYSALLSHSLRSYSEIYDSDGNFSVENAIAIVADNMEDDDIGTIDYEPISTRRLAKMLNMSEKTVKDIKDRLEDKYELIADGTIKCPLGLLEEGYLDISPDIKLKGLQLVFYALLKYRGRPFGGEIDTWAERLGELAGISKKSVYDLFTELHKKGYVRRLPNNKLKII